jgi:hypothetical protein
MSYPTGRLAFVVVALLSAFACNRESNAPPTAVSAGWTATRGIDAPESAYLDSGSGYLFATQVGGSADAKDGNGRIVKMNGDGTVLNTNWVTGLNAPKGLRSCNGTLWTADIDQVIGVEIATGTVTSRITVPNAQFLNDVACGADGTVFVSDMYASKIIAVKDGAASVWAEGEDLEWPNGLLVDGDRLIVGGWGMPPRVPQGRLLALDLTTKVKTAITPNPIGNIDGIESDGRGGWVITDWMSGKLMHVSATGEVRDLQTFMQGAADLAYIADKQIAIVPHMNENKIVSYDLSSSLR